MKSTANPTGMLTTAARSAIVSCYVSALSTTENTGGLLTQVCEVVAKHSKGKPLSDGDSKAIVTDIASAKGWKGASAASRMSEVRIILKAADKLPDAIDAYRAKAKQCTWHDGMKMARGLAKGRSITQCVKAAFEKKDGNTGTPEGRTAGALKAWWKASPRKREAILAAASTLGLKLGIKMDA